jgi:hypothetical protein
VTADSTYFVQFIYHVLTPHLCLGCSVRMTKSPRKWKALLMDCPGCTPRRQPQWQQQSGRTWENKSLHCKSGFCRHTYQFDIPLKTRPPGNTSWPVFGACLDSWMIPQNSNDICVVHGVVVWPAWSPRGRVHFPWSLDIGAISSVSVFPFYYLFFRDIDVHFGILPCQTYECKCNHAKKKIRVHVEVSVMVSAFMGSNLVASQCRSSDLTL